jgi:hypothetical protein
MKKVKGQQIGVRVHCHERSRRVHRQSASHRRYPCASTQESRQTLYGADT